MSRLLFRLLLVAFVSGTWVSAQEAPSYTLKIDVPFVAVDVAVTDVAGTPVRNLNRDDFELYEDGIRQEVRYFSPVSTAYNIFLLFDRSGSTQHKWPFMQKAVAGFISNLRPQDRIAIGTFDFEFDLCLPWTDDRGKAILALPDLIRAKATGGTYFYNALERVLDRQFRKVTGRRVIVVLTDGRDTSMYRDVMTRGWIPDPPEDREFQKLIRAALQHRIPIYFIAVNTDNNLEPNTQGSDEYQNLRKIFRDTPLPLRYLTAVRVRMQEIADVTGGRILFPQRMEDIIPLYEQIGRELGMSYSLGYISANSAMDGAFRRIEVKTRDGKLRIAQSRAGYYAK